MRLFDAAQLLVDTAWSEIRRPVQGLLRSTPWGCGMIATGVPNEDTRKNDLGAAKRGRMCAGLVGVSALKSGLEGKKELVAGARLSPTSRRRWRCSPIGLVEMRPHWLGGAGRLLRWGPKSKRERVDWTERVIRLHGSIYKNRA